mgnify:CR=1 FL=1
MIFCRSIQRSIVCSLFFKVMEMMTLITVFGVLWNYDITVYWVRSYPAVPAGLVDTCVSISGWTLDMPKSETLAVILPSSRMLLGFTSLWITGGSWIDHVRYISHHTLVTYTHLYFFETELIIYIGFELMKICPLGIQCEYLK